MAEQTSKNQITEELQDALSKMKAAYAKAPAPSAKERIDRLNRLHNALVDYKDRLLAAVNEDFGGRAEPETLMEYLPILEGIRYNKKHLRSWMRQSHRHVPQTLLGTQAKVHYQPLGVIGIVAPWNFPIFLGLSPLVGAFAAGNRAMLKTSEFAPHTSDVIKEMIGKTFSDEEAVVFTGGVDVATEFTKLPFDHLVFTGSTQVGRIVMHAAADNLTPVTLELGGKSPTIVHASFPIEEAAKRIAFSKGLNAGQVCVSPDYVLVPRGKVDDFITALEEAFTSNYPTLEENSDYTSIITDRHRDRLRDVVTDATQKGATAIAINPAGESFDGTKKLPMTLLKDVNDDMQVMQEEIFGPILPVVPYDTLDDAIAYVNARPRPLALYYFDWDKPRGERVLRDTHSGGVCFNDAMNHVVVDDMPFGGIGPSGMGHYHGKEGFLNFSKAKGVLRKGRFDPWDLMGAPWGNRLFNLFLSYQFWRFRRIG